MCLDRGCGGELCFPSGRSAGVGADKIRAGAGAGGRPARGIVGPASKMADAFGDELFSVFEEDSAAAASGAKKSKAAATEGARRPG